MSPPTYYVGRPNKQNKQTNITNWTENKRINLYRHVTDDNYSICPSRFKVDLRRFFPRRIKSTFLRVVDLCRPDDIHSRSLVRLH